MALFFGHVREQTQKVSVLGYVASLFGHNSRRRAEAAIVLAVFDGVRL